MDCPIVGAVKTFGQPVEIVSPKAEKIAWKFRVPGQIAARHDFVVEEAVKEGQFIAGFNVFLHGVVWVDDAHIAVEEEDQLELGVRLHPVGQEAVAPEEKVRLVAAMGSF